MFLKNFIFIFFILFLNAANAAVNIQHWQTSQGAEVYFVENHSLPMIDLSVNFAAGSAYDPPEKSGLAGVTKYMMSLGAAGLGEDVISNQLSNVGAGLGGDFDLDRAAFKLRTLSSKKEKDQALSTLKIILQKPDFPEKVLEREKSRMIASLQEAATQPESIANRVFMEALYGSHPYAKDGDGTETSIQKLSRQDLVEFHQQFYHAKGAVIAMIGDLSREEANQIAEDLTNGLPLATVAHSIPDVTVPAAPIEKRVSHPASQSHILLGYPGTKRGDADLFPLYVGNYILGGGGFVSRLTEEVREKRGLVYSVYSYFMPMKEFGPFQIGLQTKKEQADEALKVVHDTLDNFLKKGVTAQELKAAKANIIGGFPMRIDSNKKILDYLSVIGFYKLPLDYLEQYNKNVASVTAVQIKEAFNRRIKPENFVTIIVGDAPNQ
jgi:zinc protease